MLGSILLVTRTGGATIMETGMFFKILGFLLVIGTFSSLLMGTPIPGSTTIVSNITVNASALLEPRVVCDTWVPGWCGLTDMGTAVANMVWAFLGTIYSGILFGIAIFGFFSGITAYITGGTSFAIPAPLNLIFFIVLAFAWLFLALEAIRSVIGIIWGR